MDRPRCASNAPATRRREGAGQLSVWERMGARRHPTRARAAFDRLLPWQMETAVFIPPMPAARLEDPRRLADARYIAEPKLDGQRVQLHVRGHRICTCSA